jgi:hypothetical protein
MTHRRLVPSDAALASLAIPSGLEALYRRMFEEPAHRAL